MSTMPNMQNQTVRDLTFDASGTVTTGGVAQLVLPERKSTTMLLICNPSTTSTLYFTFGSAVLTASLTGSGVSSVTVVNAGFGFTAGHPPVIEFLGGGRPFNTAAVATGLIGFDAPTHPARATCVMASATPLPGLKIASVTIDDPGTGYVTAPQVRVTNDVLDPQGVAVPVANAAGTIPIGPFGSLSINDITNPTDAIAVISATTSAPFTVKWRP